MHVKGKSSLPAAPRSKGPSTNETFRTERSKGDVRIKGSQGGAVADDAVRYIERSAA